MAYRKQARAENEPNQMTTRRTVILMFLCGIVAFIVLIAQLASIMIRQHDYYESRAVEDQVRSTTVNASRGTIYDTKMLILAHSATVETVYISPFEMVRYGEDKEAIAAALSRILDVDYDSIMKKWEDTESWYKTIRLKVEKELADEVRAYVNGGFLEDPAIFALLNEKTRALLAPGFATVLKPAAAGNQAGMMGIGMIAARALSNAAAG